MESTRFTVLLFRKTHAFQAYCREASVRGLQVGFVPTMGALHQGHLALIRRAIAENDLALVSIFVNPTQFNQETDLENYPRTPETDIEQLVRTGCHLLYLPDQEEVYPQGTEYALDWSPGPLEEVMEGAHRPGHFRGVAQVVKRLLDIVQPSRLYMGQKDYQQVRIIQALIAHYDMPVELVMHPIVREADGLAMSSRNVRLSPQMRAQATVLYRALKKARQAFRQNQHAAEIEQEALEQIRASGLTPEYVSIADAETLQAWAGQGKAVACVAAWAGDVRLIDNLELN